MKIPIRKMTPAEIKALRKAASIGGQTSWASKSPEQRKAHMKMMTEKAREVNLKRLLNNPVLKSLTDY